MGGETSRQRCSEASLSSPKRCPVHFAGNREGPRGKTRHQLGAAPGLCTSRLPPHPSRLLPPALPRSRLLMVALQRARQGRGSKK